LLNKQLFWLIKIAFAAKNDLKRWFWLVNSKYFLQKIKDITDNPWLAN